jgi:hypothetical protein
MATAVDSLEHELGARVPEGVAALPAADLGTLADLLRSAKRRQAQQLEEGVEDSLDFVPRLMRGPVRRILFG